MPPAIRIMIWGYCLEGERTVILDHGFYRDGKIPKAEIIESCPVVLHICHEAREFVLKVYNTENSDLKLEGWDLNTYQTRRQLQFRLQKVRIKPARKTKEMYAQFTSYMNENPGEGSSFSRFAEYSKRCRPVIFPRWFDPASDTLLIRPSRLTQDIRNYGLQKLFKLKQCQLRFLAIKLLPQAEHFLVQGGSLVYHELWPVLSFGHIKKCWSFGLR